MRRNARVRAGMGDASGRTQHGKKGCTAFVWLGQGRSGWRGNVPALSGTEKMAAILTGLGTGTSMRAVHDNMNDQSG